MAVKDQLSEHSRFTDFGFTGQRDYSYIQLIDFNARFCGPTLGRFIQPDSVIPDLANPQSLNRFSYVLNSPLVLVDPSVTTAC